MKSAFAQSVSEQTLEQAKRHCVVAQAKIYKRFAPAVYTLAMRILQDENDAQDALQDIFIKVFQRLSQYRSDSPFWGWLRQVAVNTTLTMLKKRQKLRQELTLHELLEDSWSAVLESPGTQMDLSQGLARLPAKTRAVLWLYDVEGYSHKEIAKMLGKTDSFSKSQVSRGRKALAKILNPENQLQAFELSTPVEQAL